MRTSNWSTHKYEEGLWLLIMRRLRKTLSYLLIYLGWKKNLTVFKSLKLLQITT